MNTHLAYLISAHTDPAQLSRLIASLQPEAHFFIHIDKKSDLSSFTSLIRGDNIHFLSDRVDVRWGTLIEVEYQMKLIKAAIDHPQHFDRIFFLSGMDYPLWSKERISEWAAQLGEREILSGINMNTPLIQGQQRLLYTLPRPLFTLPAIGNKWNQRLSIVCRRVCKLLGIRRPLSLQVNGQQWDLYKGSAWWCISQELAEHVYRSYTTIPAIRHYFSSSFGQAETLIQTIAFNSPQWRSRCLLFEGEYPGLEALTPLHFISYQPVIRVMDETDLDRLLQSGRMFTRKLISGKSDLLVEKLKHIHSQRQ